MYFNRCGFFVPWHFITTHFLDFHQFFSKKKKKQINNMTIGNSFIFCCLSGHVGYEGNTTNTGIFTSLPSSARICFFDCKDLSLL